MKTVIEQTRAELEALQKEIQYSKDAEWILSFINLPF
jgi:hypothetical protein